MRWWESGSRPIEHEEAWFRKAGLLFELDRLAMARDGVVMFRGLLRYGVQRCPATIIYPPGYLSGEHPIVLAPDLPIGRHKGPGGQLCLDHPTRGATNAMIGAEAAERAEELWRLSVEAPGELRTLEADAPQPRASDYAFEPTTAISFFDVDVSSHDAGYLRLALTNRRPLRGTVVAVGYSDTHGFEDVPVGPSATRFAGATRLCGLWRRVGDPPPGPLPGEVARWIEEKQSDLLKQAVAVADAERRLRGEEVPALLAFVFRDEGPERDEWHDAWLLAAIARSGAVRLLHSFRIDQSEHWIRQPHLEPLGTKSVASIGLGALGSQIAALLARAGLGEFFGVDPDVVTPANRIRHEADLSDIGVPKVIAAEKRLRQINPYIRCRDASGARFGAVNAHADLQLQQAEEDRIVRELGTCDLIINSSAHVATGMHVSAVADAARCLALHVVVSSGAWGARILLQRHGVSGCYECLALHQERPVEDSPEIPLLSEDPTLPEVMDAGCAQATFQGPGFELTEAAAAATRVAVQALLNGDGYPAADFDLVTLRFRDQHAARPEADYRRLPRHPACDSCTGG